MPQKRTPTPGKMGQKAAKRGVESSVIALKPADNGEISANEAAKRLEMTPQAVGVWAKRPGAPVRVDGTRVWVRWPDFMRWREQELIRQAVADASPGDLESERTRKTRAEASLAELDLAKAKGQLVAITDYETALARVLDQLMARLRAIPVRLAHFGQPVEAAAESEVERIAVELSQFDEDVLDEPEAEAA